MDCDHLLAGGIGGQSHPVEISEIERADCAFARRLEWSGCRGEHHPVELDKPEMKRHRIGLISDTHGLLRPEAVAALEGSELIIHGGDVGRPEVLARLREIAAVVSVRGNVDLGPWAARLPAIDVVTVGHLEILKEAVSARIQELKIDGSNARVAEARREHLGS